MVELEPNVMLAITLIGLGMTTFEKLKEVWKSHGVSDADVDAIISEAEARIARRSTAADPT